MSWDVVIFNSTQKINAVEEIDEEMFEPIDFCSILVKHFPDIKQDEDHREIQGDGFSIEYFSRL